MSLPHFVLLCPFSPCPCTLFVLPHCVDTLSDLLNKAVAGQALTSSFAVELKSSLTCFSLAMNAFFSSELLKLTATMYKHGPWFANHWDLTLKWAQWENTHSDAIDNTILLGCATWEHSPSRPPFFFLHWTSGYTILWHVHPLLYAAPALTVNVKPCLPCNDLGAI